MNSTLTMWILVPLLGALIGYATNRIAVKMIFRPIQPVNVLGVRVQGLMGRRQTELAESIGRVVGAHLLSHEDLMQALSGIDLEELVGGAIKKGLAPKLAELRRLPLVGGFLTDERVEDLERSIAKSVVKNREALLEELEEAVVQGIDIQSLVRTKVAAFPIEHLERLVLEVSARELRSIEILGGVLGLLIGFIQVAILTMAS